MFAFRTLCNPVATDSLPYVEDFVSYGSGSANPISPCWYKQVIGSTTQFPYPYSTAATTGNIGLYGYSTGSVYSYAVLPLFETSLSDLMIEFDLKRGSSTGTNYHTMVYVGVMTVADDLSTFDTITLIDDSENPASSITRHFVSLEGYEGTGRIALLFPQMSVSSYYNYAYVDSVVVKQLPTCRWPMNAAVDSVGAYEIDLSWTGSASNFEVQVYLRCFHHGYYHIDHRLRYRGRPHRPDALHAVLPARAWCLRQRRQLLERGGACDHHPRLRS